MTIASAAPTEADRPPDCPFHLFGECDPFVHNAPQPTVATFSTEALAVIAAAHARSALPIIVGGTTYWAQPLLFPCLPEGPVSDAKAGHTAAARELPPPFTPIGTPLPGSCRAGAAAADANFARLSRIDPAAARHLCSSDAFRVERALARAEQATPSVEYRGPSNFPSLIFWMEASAPVLAVRARARVLAMLRAGLLLEAAAFLAAGRQLRSQHPPEGPRPFDALSGALQCIGVKELAAYARRARAASPPSEDPQDEIAATFASLILPAELSPELTAVLADDTRWALTVLTADPPGDEPLHLPSRLNGLLPRPWCDILPAEAQGSDMLRRRALLSGLEDIAAATLHLSATQRRARARLEARGVPLLVLDTSNASDPQQWERLIRQPAVAALDAFLAAPAPFTVIPPSKPSIVACECGLRLAESELPRHRQGRKHRAWARDQKRRAGVLTR
jgi:tRNA A37 N6-isopentenylltransferase MiaA